MVEEKQDAAADEKPKQPKTPSRLLLFVIPGLVFLCSMAGSAWMLGLFAPPAYTPVAENIQTGTPADTAVAQTPENPMAKQPIDAYPAGSLGSSVPEPQGPSGEIEAEGSARLRAERERLLTESTELESKRRELQLIKQDIEKLLARVQEAKSERIAMMAKLYDSMDAEAVAKQIASMDDRTVVMLLPQMNTRTAAKIMALLEPKRAAQIATKLLALDQ